MHIRSNINHELNSTASAHPSAALDSMARHEATWAGEAIELLSATLRRRRALRLPGVKDLTGDSRSQVYARMNPKCSAYDPSFPLPFYVGKSPRWWEHDVIAWLERQASISTRH